MDPAELADRLKSEARQLGFDLVGACPAVRAPEYDRFRQRLATGCAGQMHYLVDRADAYEHPNHLLPGVRSLLMLGMGYRTVPREPPQPGQATVSCYAWGDDYHQVVRARLHKLIELHPRLAPEGRARGVVDTAPLLERPFARLAGLGWIGKNTLLLNPDWGSWFFLAALLTTEELAYDPPFEADHCGTCRACLDACPTGALESPYCLDARKCISYQTIELRGPIPDELRPRQQQWLLGCDLCQDVCPWNRRAALARHAGFAPRDGMNPVAAVELLTLDETGCRQRFAHSPLLRPKRSGLLRNAAITLGNAPTEAALPTLVQGANDADTIVRDACAWALGRFGVRG